jgi:hypothetical protein
MAIPQFCRENLIIFIPGFETVRSDGKAATVAHKTLLFAAIAYFLVSPPPGSAQEQQSLGDVARQARKEKEKNATKPKAVITNEGLPSSSGLTALAGGDADTFPNSSTGDVMSQAMSRFQEAESQLKKLQGWDRAKLAKAVLMENDIQFPNRQAWEDRFYAAKEQYVSHGFELIAEIRQIMAQLQTLKEAQGGAKLSPNDPQVQRMKQRLQEIVQEAVRTEQAYRAIIMEGWDLAKQTKH